MKNLIGDIFSGMPKNLLGFMNKKEKEKKTEAYKRMKMKQIAKRRARNKVARKSRRINRLRMA